MDQLPLNPMLRGMYEDELRRQEAEKAKKAMTLDEASHFKEMDDQAKEWVKKANEHSDHASKHHKLADHKDAGEAKRIHHRRMARGHSHVAQAYRDLAGCCRGRDPLVPSISNPASY